MADAQLTGSAILIAVVGGGIAAIIGVIVGVSADGLKSILRGLRAKYRTWRNGDHTALHSGYGIGTDHGGRRHYCVTIKIAPSASLGEGFELDVDAVDRWVTDTFTASAFIVDTSNPRQLIRYKAEGGQLGEAPMVTIYPTGAIEYLQPFDHTVEEDGSHILDVAVIARHISKFTAAVSRGGLKPIYKQPGLSRERVDWRVSISPSVSAPDGVGGSMIRMWTRLTFEGRAPDRRAIGQNPPATQVGYGHSRLTNVPQSTSPAEIVTTVIKAFLEESGYVGLDGCLADLSNIASRALRV